MLPPPKYTRTPAEGSCYEHHNTIIDDDDNDGDSVPLPAYTRRPNQAPSTQDNAQLTAEESNSHSTLPSPTSTPNLDIARPQQAFSPGSSRRNDFADDVRAWHTFQDWHTSAGARFNIEVFHTAPRYGYGIHGGHHAAVDFHGRPLRRRPRQRVCHNRRLMFFVASLIVMVIFAVAIAKGVAFFRRKRDEGGDSSHKSPEIQSHS